MSNVKLSGIPTNGSPTLGDYAVGVLANLSADDKVTLQNILTLFANNWAANSYNEYKFSVYSNGAFTSNGSLTKIAFDTKVFDTGSNFDVVTNNRFVAPIAGFYYFKANVLVQQNSGTGYQTYLYKNGSNLRDGMSIIATQTTTFALAVGVEGLFQLSANDYIEIWHIGGSANGISGAAATYFDGFLVSAT